MSDEHLISVDWGTSSLKVSVVRPRPFRVLETINDIQLGVQAVHAKVIDECPADRLVHFTTVLKAALQRLETIEPGFPVLISGMASSSIGMLELPYQSLPISLNAPNLKPRHLTPANNWPHSIYLFTGWRDGERDIMRGEEAQVLGLTEKPVRATVILPGTHSKHIKIQDATMVRFTTFMTGEFFELMSSHSILRHSIDVQSGSMLDSTKAFKEGVGVGAGQPLLASLFGIRPATLFGKRSPSHSADYLSGLLIGSEIATLLDGSGGELILCGGSLTDCYQLALETLGMGKALRVIPQSDSEQATARMHAMWWVERAR